MRFEEIISKLDDEPKKFSLIDMSRDAWKGRVSGLMILFDVVVFDIIMAEIIRPIIGNDAWVKMVDIYVFAFFGVFCISLIFALIVSGVNWRTYTYFGVGLMFSWHDTLFWAIQGKLPPERLTWLAWQPTRIQLFLYNLIGLLIIVALEIYAQKRKMKTKT